MPSVIWTTILVNPIFNLLALMYYLTQSLGISIILLTVAIRTILIPFVIPSMKTMKKQRDLQPEIDALKKKYKYDKKKQAEMQMELFKRHGLNPLAHRMLLDFAVALLVAPRPGPAWQFRPPDSREGEARTLARLRRLLLDGRRPRGRRRAHRIPSGFCLSS